MLDSSGIWVNRSSRCFATEPTSERRGGHKPPRPLSGYTPLSPNCLLHRPRHVPYALHLESFFRSRRTVPAGAGGLFRKQRAVDGEPNMATQRLYVVHGMGSDAVGLVGHIAAPIARAKGNILDLRQDVLHGLFTIYMVVDLTGSQLTAKKLQTLVDQIGEQTGLELTASPYRPDRPRQDELQFLLQVQVIGIMRGDRDGFSIDGDGQYLVFPDKVLRNDLKHFLGD